MQTLWLSVLYNQSYCRSKFYIARIGILLVWPWPWPDDLHIQTWSVFPREVQKWTSHVKAFTSYRLRDIQTDRYDRNYVLLCFAGGQLANVFMLNHCMRINLHHHGTASIKSGHSYHTDHHCTLLYYCENMQIETCFTATGRLAFCEGLNLLQAHKVKFSTDVMYLVF